MGLTLELAPDLVMDVYVQANVKAVVVINVRVIMANRTDKKVETGFIQSS